jgi:anti-anti-sigma factor
MDVVVIEFDGEIEDFPILIQTVDNLIASGTRHLVLDLQGLPFINSAALGYLIKAQQAMEQEGGEIALSRLEPALTKILEMTDLDVIFPAFETIEEAVDFMSAAAEAEGVEERAYRRHDWR